MQEPSGLLALFLPVFLPLVRRRSEASGAAAPQRPVAQTCVGGLTKIPHATAQPAPNPTIDQGDSREGCCTKRQPYRLLRLATGWQLEHV